MCGITGFWSKEKASEKLSLRMAERIKVRGPDDAGAWQNKEGTFALAHRRLSIVDLSPAGHQPMASSCGFHVLGFNGEIYNHEDLRNELDTEFGEINWNGRSDTEVLLNGLKFWGVEKTLAKLNGMFAFAYWREHDQILVLARDRMGEKPLYFGRQDSTFLFGSELAPLKVHPKFSSNINRDALALFLRYNCVPAPHSIYSNIHKLKPAHYVVVSNYGQTISDQHCYWDLAQVAAKGPGAVTDEGQILEDLDFLLRDSVKRRMMADVPLGAFLSGGYDSTTVAALMQVQSSTPIKTFSIGFKEDAFNEAQYAKRVASHLGTDHTEMYLEAQQALDVIPKLPNIYDEPFSDSSQIPTFLVSQLARQQVTVALSGDGGDELFCGYSRYNLGFRMWSKLHALPSAMRPLAVWLCRVAPGASLDVLQRLLPERYRIPNLADRLPKLAEVLENETGEQFYKTLVSHHKHPAELVLGSEEPSMAIDDPRGEPRFTDLREKMMFTDMLSYLPDDILTKVDRASMAVSLEARVPLLDHRLVEFAWQIPLDLKIKHGQGKWPLRQVLYKYVPKALMERPKQGFGVPIEHWLKGPLKGWASDLLDENRLRQEGYFSPEPVVKMWKEHLSGKRRWHYQLWDILMFQAWLENA